MTNSQFINPGEIWKAISGYSNYEVSDLGNVLNSKTGRILKPFLDRQGYRQVVISYKCIRKQYRIACLVAKAFIGDKPYGTLVHHKDRVRTNDMPSNLEYLSYRDHNMEHITVFSGKNGSSTKLKKLDVFYLRYWVRTELAYSVIAKMFNISESYVSTFGYGKRWRYF